MDQWDDFELSQILEEIENRGRTAEESRRKYKLTL
jgi:hypothetical protein